MNRPRVLIADDHTLLVEAFRNLISPQFEVVGTVGDGRSLIREAQRLKPDVILVDIAMPLLNGLDATQQLKQLLPTARIIILTMSEDSELASEALRRGAHWVSAKDLHGHRTHASDQGRLARKNLHYTCRSQENAGRLDAEPQTRASGGAD